MCSCEKCGKEFTEKRSLLRNMKTHLQSTEAYTCDVCGKDFDREDARNRHMKTHLKDLTVSGQTYSCGVCGKEFSRADNRNRHEAAHSYSLTCGHIWKKRELNSEKIWKLWKKTGTNCMKPKEDILFPLPKTPYYRRKIEEQDDQSVKEEPQHT